MTPDEKALYDLVARSLIAAHYPDYAYESTRLRVVVGGHEFRADGAVPVDTGWRAVLAPVEKKAAAPLPDVREGEARTAQKVSARKKQTKPPERLNDASLLSLMEHAGQELEDEELRERMKASGLGTPATRAATIERLIEVGLAERSGKSIVSTEKGRKLIAVAPEQIASAATTGKWERRSTTWPSIPTPPCAPRSASAFCWASAASPSFWWTRRRPPRRTCALSARSRAGNRAPPRARRRPAPARRKSPPPARLPRPKRAPPRQRAGEAAAEGGNGKKPLLSKRQKRFLRPRALPIPAPRRFRAWRRWCGR